MDRYVATARYLALLIPRWDILLVELRGLIEMKGTSDCDVKPPPFI